jgi:pyruvate dehydrogenase E2 component (dihydrolipoamide acetyltransferase)
VVEFLLPDVGEGIAEAEILGWLVAPGDRVVEGQPLVEISTDKVNVELPSPWDGTVTALHHAVGDVVPVGTALLTIDADRASGSVPPAPPTDAHPAPAATHAGPRNPRALATPPTRRLASQLGIDLATVRGSGPGGRILRADVMAAAESLGRVPPTAPAPTPPALAAVAPAPSPRTTPAPETPAPATPASTTPALTTPAPAASTSAPGPVSSTMDGVRRERPRGVRATAFERMRYSAQTYATATTTFEVHGDGILRLAEIPVPDGSGQRLGVLPVLLAAIARVLTRHPRFNATVDEATGDLLLHPAVNLAVAVATDDGLVVPVLRDAARRRPLELRAELADLAERARTSRLRREDIVDGTFTVSSTGGLERLPIVGTTPLINPPQIATLWCSRITTRPRVTDGCLEAGPVMTCSLSFDHRFLDGADATAFLNDLAATFIEPERALV